MVTRADAKSSLEAPCQVDNMHAEKLKSFQDSKYDSKMMRIKRQKTRSTILKIMGVNAILRKAGFTADVLTTLRCAVVAKLENSEIPGEGDVVISEDLIHSFTFTIQSRGNCLNMAVSLFKFETTYFQRRIDKF